MDRKKLKELLNPFVARCSEKGKPLSGICIEEAYPGDVSTSFIIQVKAPWTEDISCYDAIDFLFDVLWETTDEETRRKIFSIQIMGSKDQLHDWSDTEMARK